MKSSVRVLYLTMNPNRESTTRPTECWLDRLPERGLEPVLVSSEAGAFMAWAKGKGIPTYALPLPVPDKRRPWSLLSSLFRLWRIVRRHRIQLIHCNEQNIYPIGQYLARLCRLPVVVSVHFTMQASFSHWAFGGARCPTRIFFISEGNLRECRPGVEGVIPESRWRLLYNTIDFQWYRRDESRRAAFRGQHGLADKLVLGTAAALRPRKQFEHLFEAAARLSNPRVQVVVAGRAMPGDERYAEKLIADAGNRLGDRFLYLGHCDDLRDFYNGVDVFINTSQEEACPMSVLEARACGCPVVGYPSKVADELVLPDGGELVSQDDIEALAACLERWLADPERLAAARGLARQQAEKKFDTQRIVDQLWNEYLEVLDEARR